MKTEKTSGVENQRKMESIVNDAMGKPNTPYQKIMDDDELLNPITKERPYFSISVNRRELKRRLRLSTLKNNKKGTRLIVTNINKGVFMKTLIQVDP